MKRDVITLIISQQTYDAIYTLTDAEKIEIADIIEKYDSHHFGEIDDRDRMKKELTSFLESIEINEGALKRDIDHVLFLLDRKGDQFDFSLDMNKLYNDFFKLKAYV